jgi:predicted enzyme related to lactoylglutathione lyase
MFENTPAFSGFAVNDLAVAKEFYGQTLGIKIDESMGLILKLSNGNDVYIYEKGDHVPATYTILNFDVPDIDQAVTDLKAKGVQFELYDGLTDIDGVARGKAKNMGPDIAWFKDPAGNILSVLNGDN